MRGFGFSRVTGRSRHQEWVKRYFLVSYQDAGGTVHESCRWRHFSTVVIIPAASTWKVAVPDHVISRGSNLNFAHMLWKRIHLECYFGSVWLYGWLNIHDRHSFSVFTSSPNFFPARNKRLGTPVNYDCLIKPRKWNKSKLSVVKCRD